MLRNAAEVLGQGGKQGQYASQILEDGIADLHTTICMTMMGTSWCVQFECLCLCRGFRQLIADYSSQPTGG